MTDFCSTFSDTVGFWFFIKLEIKLIWNTFVYFQSRTYFQGLFHQLVLKQLQLAAKFSVFSPGQSMLAEKYSDQLIDVKTKFSRSKNKYFLCWFHEFFYGRFSFSLESLIMKNQILIWFEYSDLMFFERPNVSATINILSFCRFPPSQPEKSRPSLILSLKSLSYFENLFAYWWFYDCMKCAKFLPT